VKFRETHSIPFEIQTVGRILRMPEQMHYKNEMLNRGYIYTNLRSIEVKKEEYNPNIIKHLRAARIPEYKLIKLKSYYKARADYGDVTSSFNKVFAKVANEYFGLKNNVVENIKIAEKAGINLDIKKYQQEIIADAHVDTKAFDDMEGAVSADTFAKLSVHAGELHLFFEQTIKNNLGSFKNVKRSVTPVKTAIYLWFEDVFGSKKWTEEFFMIQKIFQHDKNRGVFEHILAEAIDRYKAVKEEEVRERIEESEQWYDFELKPEQFYNEYTDKIVRVKNYAYEPCYLNVDRSQPEMAFETFLGTNSAKIDWWWKNGENKLDYFGLKYEYQGSIYTFYPDYLVKLKDGRLGILEVKESNDRDGLNYTKAKAETLQKYIGHQKNKKLFGGLVIEKNRAWLLNDNSKYNWEKCEKDDWGEWSILNL
jgi:type III restriction enzyme